jgi:hypothetical protein
MIVMKTYSQSSSLLYSFLVIARILIWTKINELYELLENSKARDFLILKDGTDSNGEDPDSSSVASLFLVKIW